jgi:hypothetical protein
MSDVEQHADVEQNALPEPPTDMETSPSNEGAAADAAVVESGSLRAHEIKIALIGIAGVLAGALVGGIVAGSYTTESATKQIVAESERSRTEFLRSKQQEAYAQFVTAESNLQRAREAYILQYDAFAPGGSSAADVATLYGQLRQQFVSVSQAVGNVVIIGSPQAAGLAREIHDVHSWIVYLDARGDRDGIPEGGYVTGSDTSGDPLANQQAVTTELEAQDMKLNDLRTRFIEQARRDIGT